MLGLGFKVFGKGHGVLRLLFTAYSDQAEKSDVLINLDHVQGPVMACCSRLTY